LTNVREHSTRSHSDPERGIYGPSGVGGPATSRQHPLPAAGYYQSPSRAGPYTESFRTEAQMDRGLQSARDSREVLMQDYQDHAMAAGTPQAGGQTLGHTPSQLAYRGGHDLPQQQYTAGTPAQAMSTNAARAGAYYPTATTPTQQPSPAYAATPPGQSQQESRQYVESPVYEYSDSKTRKRSNLPKQSTEIMKRWFDEHIENPYPSEEQKKYFATKANINLTQVRVSRLV